MWRSFWKSRHWYTNTRGRQPASPAEAWVDLLLMAEWKDRSFIDKHGDRVDLKRGDVLTGISALASRWRWTRNRVRRWIRDAQKAGELSRKTDTKTDTKRTTLTICNYEKWQGRRTPSEPPSGPHLTKENNSTTNQQTVDFERFWKAYPRRPSGQGSKKQAREVWTRKRPPVDEVLAALSWQRHLPEWEKDGGRFVKQPVNYLKAELWKMDKPKGEEPKYQTAAQIRADMEAAVGGDTGRDNETPQRDM